MYFDNQSRIVEQSLLEDIGSGDITTQSLIDESLKGKAKIYFKEDGILSGIEIAQLVFQTLDDEILFKSFFQDGDKINSKQIIAEINGKISTILKGERTALNFLQRMCGIATLTNQFVEIIKNYPAKITDTRKTVPQLRLFDKLAVKHGRGINHRFGLDDMVLIKDNHIAICGSVSNAIEKCVKYLSKINLKLKIEVEVKSISEVYEALKYKNEIDRIMLDNFSISEMEKAVEIISNQVEVEASGNVSLENVNEIANTKVDFISIGKLTHSVKAIDISLEIDV